MRQEDQVGGNSQDNGFADLAVLTSVAETDGEQDSEFGFEDWLALLEETVTRHPLNRELLYKVLAFCSEERELGAIEAFVLACPEFKVSTQTPYHLINTLAKAHGLEPIERDAQGEIITAERTCGLGEDELDDLVCSESYCTTDVGTRFVALHHPRARLIELLNLVPERTTTYLELLNFVAETPRTYSEINSLLEGKPALETLIDGERTIMQPSVFVDKLERSGAVVWMGGWTLTEEGNAYLKELQR